MLKTNARSLTDFGLNQMFIFFTTSTVVTTCNDNNLVEKIRMTSNAALMATFTPDTQAERGHALAILVEGRGTGGDLALGLCGGDKNDFATVSSHFSSQI